MPHISDRVRALANGDLNSSKSEGSVYRIPDRLPLPMYFRQRRLTELVRHVQGCRACPRMEGRKRVLTSENGSAAVVDPVVIATLGQSALSALSLIREHSYKLSRVVGTGVEWNGRILFPLYHTSPRAMIHRSITKQTMDFRWLKELVDAKVR
jgi:uracil-DNA glycosylase